MKTKMRDLNELLTILLEKIKTCKPYYSVGSSVYELLFTGVITRDEHYALLVYLEAAILLLDKDPYTFLFKWGNRGQSIYVIQYLESITNEGH